MKISEILKEVNVIDTRKDVSKQKPLKSNETIRVYHATDDPKYLIDFLTNGLTGDTNIPRKYSYEVVNNPKGLFVTIDLKTAKEFGPYIIEFHTKMENLEAPVWKGGNYTTQGGYSQQYNNDAERKADQEELRTISRKSQHDAIAKSDQPDVAGRLLDFSENQALFVGNLNPNSIRAVWISNNPRKINQDYTRLPRTKAIQLLKKKGIPARYSDQNHEFKSQTKNKKIFKPQENATYQEFIKRLSQKFKHLSVEKINQLFSNSVDLEQYAKDFTWNDTQVKNIINSKNQ